VLDQVGVLAASKSPGQVALTGEKLKCEIAERLAKASTRLLPTAPTLEDLEDWQAAILPGNTPVSAFSQKGL